MIIRKTERRDLPALLDIYNDEVEHGVATLDLHPRTAEQWDQWFADHSSDTHFILTAEIVTGAETIVLGGGVSAQGETLLSPLQAKLDRMETPYREKFRLTIAPDGNASGTLGARKYFEESLRREK